jgi:conjugative relaxase-like TrwC/TraI family protein
MLTIKAAAGAAAQIEYYTRNDACGIAASGEGHQHDATDYYLRDGIGEEAPAGVWLGAGVEKLGLQQGAIVDEDDAKAVFVEMVNPTLRRELLAEAAAEIADKGLTEADAEAAVAARGVVPHGRVAKEIRDQFATERAAIETAHTAEANLGRRPNSYKKPEERAAEKIRREHFVTEARAMEILREEQAKGQNSGRTFYDAAFAQPKSVSVFYASLVADNRMDEAQVVLDANEAGVKAAAAWLQEHAGYARAGHHGKHDVNRPSVGRYVEAHDWTMAMFAHRTNRELDPHLHTHLLISGRVETANPDGTTEYRALDASEMFALSRGADAVYRRTTEQYITSKLETVYDTREDGKAREIRGIGLDVRDLFSSGKRLLESVVTQWAEEFEETSGHKPNSYQMACAREIARLETRATKVARVSDADFVRVINDRMTERFGRTMGAEAGKAMAEGQMATAAGERVRPEDIDQEAVIRAAVADVQKAEPAWNRAMLLEAIERHTPSIATDVAPEDVVTLMWGMVEKAIDGDVLTGPDKLVQVAGMELYARPDALRHATGRSMYRPGGGSDELFATTAALDAEKRILATARTSREELVMSKRLAEKIVTGAKLTGDQAEVTRQVLTSGRIIDVLAAPAGTGKTYTMGAIVTAWEEYTDGRVIGLALSQKATRVLKDAGVQNGMNLERFARVQRGIGNSRDVGPGTLRAGDLVIIDEASMASRDHVDVVEAAVRAAGAKLLLAGDPEQMEAVEASGVYKMLCESDKVPTLKLSSVWRFRDEHGMLREWEADASLRLREGELEALAVYDEHGMLYGGTVEELREQIAEWIVADREEGKSFLAVCGTNESAAALNAAVRNRLIEASAEGRLSEANRVEPLGVDISDGNVAGVGDLIEARKNDHRIKDNLGEAIDNHDLFLVRARNADGSLAVTRVKDDGDTRGDTLDLPEKYLQSHVALGYASTIHSAEGRTVKRGYSLFDGAISRRATYVAGTRGSEYNRICAVTERAPDPHNPERLEASHPIEVIGGHIEQYQTEMSALDWQTSELEHQRSLATIGAEYDDLALQAAQPRYAEAVRDRIGPDRFEDFQKDPSTIYRRLQQAEFEGHDVNAVLDQALKASIEDAKDVDKLVHWRIEQALRDRVPERDVLITSYVERTPTGTGAEFEEHMLELAERMDVRRAELGERTVEAPPPYLTERIGPLPEDPLERLGWIEKATAVETYRERYGITSKTDVLGTGPGRGLANQVLDRRVAQEALGLEPMDQKMMDATNTELQSWINDYLREEKWAPEGAGTDLREARKERHAEHVQAVLTAKVDPQQSEIHREAEQHAVERIAALEEIDAGYRAWHVETEQSRMVAQAAAYELEKRGLVPETELVTPPEQPEPEPAPEQEFELQQQNMDLSTVDAEPESEADAEPEDDLQVRLRKARAAVAEVDAREAARSMDSEEELPEPSAWLRYDDVAPTLETEPGPGLAEVTQAAQASPEGPSFEMSS